MFNSVWSQYIRRQYQGFHNNIEVMMVIGYWTDNENEDIIEYIEYYTSLEEDTITENIRTILQGMSKYAMLRKGQAKFMFVHNHPSGNSYASDTDRLMAKRLRVACQLMGVQMTGSYIYVRTDRTEDGIHLIDNNRREEINTQRIVLNNQYADNGHISFSRLSIIRRLESIARLFREDDMYQVVLNETIIDIMVEDRGLSPYLLAELDETNNIIGMYELDKLQPNLENSHELGIIHSFGMATVISRGEQRLLVYDKREGVDRDRLGLAEDTKKVIQAMGVIGYPINYYIY